MSTSTISSEQEKLSNIPLFQDLSPQTSGKISRGKINPAERQLQVSLPINITQRPETYCKTRLQLWLLPPLHH
jgi:hypothetical protein